MSGELFAGEQFDAETNHYYLRARYLNPSFGRFTQQDTWQGRNNEPITLNKYLYANADPVNHIDPTGNFSVGQILAATSVAGIMVANATTTYVNTLASTAPSGGGGSGWSPDIDGRITIHEAVYWWRNGNGQAQSVPLSSVDLQGISAREFSFIGETRGFRLDFTHYSNASDAAVYGGLSLKLVAPNRVEYVGGAEFNFEMHQLPGQFNSSYAYTVFRNIATLGARDALGRGQSFDIDLTGQATVY